jgi:3-phenylpropionate/cinnamic acid dioxygenase small subunit
VPLSTDDIIAIQQLVARYAVAVDTDDAGGFLACFTPDGAFSSSFANARGREELLAMRGRGVPGRTRHFITNLIIEGDGDNATVNAYLFSTRPVLQDSTVGTYENDVVKLDGKWQFKHVRVSRDARAE